LTEPVPWGPREAILAVVLYVAAQLLIGTFLLATACGALSLMDPGVLRDRADLMLAGFQVSLAPTLLASSAVIIGYIAWSISRIHHRPVLVSLGLARPEARAAAGWSAAGIVMALLLAGVMHLAPPGEDDTGGMLTQLAESGTSGWLLWLTLALLVAPIVEELLFRGYVYPGVRGALGPGRAALAVSGLFTLMHTGETGLYLPALGGLLCLALLLAFIREATGNLVCCILCHLSYNGTLALLSAAG